MQQQGRDEGTTTTRTEPDLLVDARNSALRQLSLNLPLLCERLPELKAAVQGLRAYLEHDETWRALVTGKPRSEAVARDVAEHYLSTTRLSNLANFEELGAALRASGLLTPAQHEQYEAQRGRVHLVPLELHELLASQGLRECVDEEAQPRALDEIKLAGERWTVRADDEAGRETEVKPWTLRALCSALEGALFLNAELAPRCNTVFVRLASPLYAVLHPRVASDKAAAGASRLRLGAGGQLYVGVNAQLACAVLKQAVETARELAAKTHGQLYL